MKNIHVLATSKDSRLFYSDNSKELKLLLYPISFKTFERSTQHIYITNDEEIKEGDWVINLNSPYAHKEICRIDNQFELERYAKKTSNNCKKIILTTDQDLIGVQAIDDEFLEWFVKNPSCEYVEVEKYHGINTSIAEINTVSGDGSLKWEGKSDLRDYKIIIPQEEPKDRLRKVLGTKEPKQEGYICPHTKVQCDDECCVSAEDCHIKSSIGILSEPKQETLEEAFYRIQEIKKNLDYSSFYLGAKLQQGQDKNKYSEEEVIDILESLVQHPTKPGYKRRDIMQFIEEFKKK
jgi:hypothetical protein